jgi:glyoxylase-like metal-dependent hydrolase (beta-lactamase superfamily II)
MLAAPSICIFLSRLQKEVKTLIEQILAGIYRLEVPIPNSPLKATNAYLIKGDSRNLLVDTGTNTEKSLAFIRCALDELSVDLSKTDIITTHMHSDHAGLVPSLKTDTSILYATISDAESINNLLTADTPMERLYRAACRNGLSQDEAAMAMQRHPANTAGSKEPLNFTFVVEGTVLTVGDYRFTCIETPGHTKGHVCLYEPAQKFLLSGDHILGDISPNITHYWGDGNPLADFMASLKKIAALSVELVLPGHRRIFTDCRGRINELLEHHRRRIDEAYDILADGPKNGYQVAARMTWDMVFTSWDDVGAPQKYFATGEALSHLRYLECKGLIQSAVKGDNTVYWR